MRARACVPSVRRESRQEQHLAHRASCVHVRQLEEPPELARPTREPNAERERREQLARAEEVGGRLDAQALEAKEGLLARRLVDSAREADARVGRRRRDTNSTEVGLAQRERERPMDEVDCEGRVLRLELDSAQRNHCRHEQRKQAVELRWADAYRREGAHQLACHPTRQHLKARKPPPARRRCCRHR